MNKINKAVNDLIIYGECIIQLTEKDFDNLMKELESNKEPKYNVMANPLIGKEGIPFGYKKEEGEFKKVIFDYNDKYSKTINNILDEIHPDEDIISIEKRDSGFSEEFKEECALALFGGTKEEYEKFKAEHNKRKNENN